MGEIAKETNQESKRSYFRNVITAIVLLAASVVIRDSILSDDPVQGNPFSNTSLEPTKVPLSVNFEQTGIEPGNEIFIGPIDPAASNQ